MTIALILGNMGRGNSDDRLVTANSDDDDGKKARRKDPQTESQPAVKGGTLIICPMALLGQWKVRFCFNFFYRRRLLHFSCFQIKLFATPSHIKLPAPIFISIRT